MLSGVNALVVLMRDRTELMRETCRLAISAGGYATAIVAAKTPGSFALQPVAWSDVNDKVTEALRAVVAESAARPSCIIGRVMQSGTPFVCNDSADLQGTVNFSSLMVKAGMCSLVVLALTIDGTAVGVLLLALLAYFDVIERAFDGRCESGRVALQHVVRGSAEQGVDGALFADRAGHEDERDLRTQLACDRERRHAIEFRQAEVRENDRRLKLFDCPAQVGLGFHALRDAGNSGAFELGQREVRLIGHVLDEQNSNRFLRCGHRQAPCNTS
jgi:hypothetical protein